MPGEAQRAHPAPRQRPACLCPRRTRTGIVTRRPRRLCGRRPGIRPAMGTCVRLPPCDGTCNRLPPCGGTCDRPPPCYGDMHQTATLLWGHASDCHPAMGTCVRLPPWDGTCNRLPPCGGTCDRPPPCYEDMRQIATLRWGHASDCNPETAGGAWSGQNPGEEITALMCVTFNRPANVLNLQLSHEEVSARRFPWISA